MHEFPIIALSKILAIITIMPIITTPVGRALSRVLLPVALILATALPTLAQQLPNSDFEGGWNDYTPWSSGYTKVYGKAPAGWCISHVAGVSAGGATEVGKDTIGFNSSSAVKIVNHENKMRDSEIVPGYLTLGKPWSTSKIKGLGSVSDRDGGTWGGIEFTYRPDAITFMYQRETGTQINYNSHVFYV